ncbi:cysteine desulfurase family protein [Rubeoparvulum massiliense]|uniref:cysteine desulfurase family protein n=1 Tax=Rubeoparvulum massiliense TaxID=1631346 RepID=UPI00065DC1FE|nr:cysteine desulfurase family protein [Rubeoparvulum massiliense]
MAMVIDLDHAATTPVRPEVVEAMLPYYQQYYGNPSSLHQIGRQARSMMDRARDLVATSLHAHPSEIIFTSGGTEADNLAIVGTAMALREQGRHIITTQIEHPAVLEAAHFLEEWGFEVTFLPVDQYGRVTIADLKAALRPDTTLISVMFGNNEVGTLQPIQAIGELAAEQGVAFHVDAVQGYPYYPIDVEELHADLLTISSHKINGPKGAGALYVRRTHPLYARQLGGKQERERRAGTENVGAIAGFAKAVELLLTEREERFQKVIQLRKVFLEGLLKIKPVPLLNGHEEETLPHIINVSFPGIQNEMMLMNLDLAGVAASAGSACSAGSIEVSHVLQAMGLDQQRMENAIRFSLGYELQVEELQQALLEITKIVQRLQA